MAPLRAYYLNGGNMLELVKYQKKEVPKAAGAELELIGVERFCAQKRAAMASWESMWKQSVTM